MINLAGNNECDKYIKEELNIAGIPTIQLLGSIRREVPASIIGYLNGFMFQRAWYYWTVQGYMPLEYANELYEKYKELSIRVAGHCGNPPPEEWCQSKNYEKLCKELGNKYWNKEITYEELDKKCKEIRKQGNQFVINYHIDTQEGLLRFAEIIKKYNIISEEVK